MAAAIALHRARHVAGGAERERARQPFADRAEPRRRRRPDDDRDLVEPGEQHVESRRCFEVVRHVLRDRPCHSS